jgi:RecA-family ATPase/phage/plasmid primase-like uncharacterized protein
LEYPGSADAGKITRFSTKAKDRSDRSGWLSVFQDGLGAAFGDWRSGESFTWQRRDTNENPPSMQEREEARQQGEAARHQAHQAREAEYQAAAEDCRAIWKAAADRPAPADFPYLTKKGIRPHLARMSPDNRLMLPVRGPDGEIQSLQYIGADGEKQFHPGGKMSAGWLFLGKSRADEPFLLCEGYATAASLNEATARAVFCCFTAGNLLPVAEMMQARFPDAVRIVCGDDDRQTEGNPGRTKATAAAEATGARVVFPEFASQTGSDFNDQYAEAGPESVKRVIDAVLRETPMKPGFTAPAITAEELASARSSPDCIVENLFFSDVGNLIAPGGVGKTTLMIHMLACIVTGRPCLGEVVRKPGPVLLVTAEDSREILVARLRSVMNGLNLSDAERGLVMGDLRIADVSGEGFKLTEVVGDVVRPNGNLAVIIEFAKEIKPVLIAIDPAVSFGVGEQRVNDAEQGLIEAARKLRNELNCGVIYIHHSGKVNGREKTLDQYSGRGGSAFADGSRMVHVLQNMTPSEWQEATGDELAESQSGLILARPKMSYCPPPGDILIRRTGFLFERVDRVDNSKGRQTERRSNQVLQLIVNELNQGRRHSQHSLELIGCGLSRAELKSSLAWLEATGRVEERKRNDTGKGGARRYLHPIGLPDDAGEAMPDLAELGEIGSPEKSSIIGSPAYREMKACEAMQAVHVPPPIA